MKITMNESMFIDRFRMSDQWKEVFSYTALQKIFELLEEDDYYDDYEFDIVSISEEFTEYDDEEEFLKEFPDVDMYDVESYDIESWDWDKDGNKIITKSLLIRKFD